MKNKRLIIYDTKANTVTVYRDDNQSTDVKSVADAKQSFYDRVAYINESGNMEFRDGLIHSFGVFETLDDTVQDRVMRNIANAKAHPADDKILLIHYDGGDVAFQFSYRIIK